MTRHLSDAEFADFADDTLAPDRAAHVESCAACREQGALLREALRDVAAVEVPEPSPLFWTHLARRVHDAVAEAPAPRASGWLAGAMRRLAPLAVAATLAVAVFSAVLLTRAVRLASVPPARLARIEPPRVPGPAHAATATAPGGENAEIWDVLTAAAATVEFDEAHDAGMHVRPAALDAAVQDLSAAERAELARLLQSELKRSSN